MNKTVSFHELAELELNDAAIFFENKTEGLGLRFVATVENAVANIRKHPEASPIVLGNVRRKVLRKFPYNILFSIRPDRIRILAIANQKRRPFYWRDRK